MEENKNLTKQGEVISNGNERTITIRDFLNVYYVGNVIGALQFITDGLSACEGSERERYVEALLDLKEGYDVCYLEHHDNYFLKMTGRKY